jgi:hypothetical protein
LTNRLKAKGVLILPFSLFKWFVFLDYRAEGGSLPKWVVALAIQQSKGEKKEAKQQEKKKKRTR